MSMASSFFIGLKRPKEPLINYHQIMITSGRKKEKTAKDDDLCREESITGEEDRENQLLEFITFMTTNEDRKGCSKMRSLDSTMKEVLWMFS
jgi:hypothetical protein